MLNIELMETGLDDTLRDIKNDLKSVLGSGFSKKQKDEVIYKTLGAVNTLWNLVRVEEFDSDIEDEHNT